jgi:type IV pilus assembly protein PilA
VTAPGTILDVLRVGEKEKTGIEGRAMERNRTNHNDRTTGSSGFTLLELMMVITVLSILVVLAVAGYSNSRKSANEASAISSLRTVSSMENIYRVRFGSYGTLSDLTTNGYMDNTYADGEKSGYLFSTTTAPTEVDWTLSAQPVTPGVSGDRWFLVDESGVIRFSQGMATTSSDPAIDY